MIFNYKKNKIINKINIIFIKIQNQEIKLKKIE